MKRIFSREDLIKLKKRIKAKTTQLDVAFAIEMEPAHMYRILQGTLVMRQEEYDKIINYLNSLPDEE